MTAHRRSIFSDIVKSMLLDSWEHSKEDQAPPPKKARQAADAHRLGRGIAGQYAGAHPTTDTRSNPEGRFLQHQSYK
jgi:hypothetical protein